LRVARYRSKTLAAWLALLAGPFGAHRLYLHGWGDLWAWLHPWPTLLGVAGVLRLRSLGQDDQLAWLLIPVLGLMIAQAMLAAILIGLTPDERWQARFNPGAAPRASGWAAVIAVIAALMVGGAALMGALAFGGEKYFQWQAEREAQADARPGNAPGPGR
jgi:hypothetical protein